MPARALFFDVFGTLVNWRPAIARTFSSICPAGSSERTALAFADAWRAGYFEAIERVRSGHEPWRDLDILHAELLPSALGAVGAPDLSREAEAALVAAWDQLDPWPDATEALSVLRRTHIVAPVSNASFRQMIAISRHAGFVWDVILGAQIARQFKTHPAVYLESAAAIGLSPADCMFVAAHNADLAAAKAVGMRTAFVARPQEYGPGQTEDLHADPSCDFAAADLHELVALLERNPS